MIAMLVIIETKYDCNLHNEEDQIWLSIPNRTKNDCNFFKMDQIWLQWLKIYIHVIRP